MNTQRPSNEFYNILESFITSRVTESSSEEIGEILCTLIQMFNSMELSKKDIEYDKLNRIRNIKNIGFESNRIVKSKPTIVRTRNLRSNKNNSDILSDLITNETKL